VGSGHEEKSTKEITAEESSTQRNYSGKLILDATCAPTDIHYPTDLWLLNTAREALEGIIDALHKHHVGKVKKSRTYRNNARKDYLNVDKKKHTTAKRFTKGLTNIAVICQGSSL